MPYLHRHQQVSSLTIPPKCMGTSPQSSITEDRESFRPNELSPTLRSTRYSTRCSHLVARRAIRKNVARKINQDPENFNKMLLEVSANCGEEEELQPLGHLFLF